MGIVEVTEALLPSFSWLHELPLPHLSKCQPDGQWPLFSWH
jgi:hypothetical protein